jgi:predicted ATPase
MKISRIELYKFKRFSHLVIENIPETAKIVVVLGPNGSGKSSLFEAFLHWYRFKFTRAFSDDDYYRKDAMEALDRGRAVTLHFHDLQNEEKETLRGRFYFRSAYRNDPDFTMSSLARQENPTDTIRLTNFIQNDSVVRENYERLVSLTLKGVYDEANDNLLVPELRNELIGSIKASLQNVFDDLTLTSIGDPLSKGSFYFEKGATTNFHYKNLSGGEKSAFDLLLDLIIKSRYYPNAVICIDEPETHMHTRLQSRLFAELFRIIPDQSQLWINTHSLGMLNKAREIERAAPGTVTFINFDGVDFDESTTLVPSHVDRTIWERFVEITLDDLSGLIAPRKVIFCEGNQLGRAYKNFDAQIYDRVFRDRHPDHAFISVGSATELENPSNITMKVVEDILTGSQIIKVLDRDSKSPEEIAELVPSGIRVLNLRNLESYLLDDEIIRKLCTSCGADAAIPAALQIKVEALARSVDRGNPPDDLKSASADIYVELKRLLRLTNAGNTKDAFFRDKLAPLITPETEIYQTLEREVLG